MTGLEKYIWVSAFVNKLSQSAQLAKDYGYGEQDADSFRSAEFANLAVSKYREVKNNKSYEVPE